jgi:hypothetical protein
LTVFKLHCGRLTLKICTKGERVLRIEAMVHNTRGLKCGRALTKFPEVIGRLKAIPQRFADALSCIDQCFLADDMLEQLPSRRRSARRPLSNYSKCNARHLPRARAHRLTIDNFFCRAFS